MSNDRQSRMLGRYLSTELVKTLLFIVSIFTNKVMSVKLDKSQNVLRSPNWPVLHVMIVMRRR